MEKGMGALAARPRRSIHPSLMRHLGGCDGDSSADARVFAELVEYESSVAEQRNGDHQGGLRAIT